MGPEYRIWKSLFYQLGTAVASADSLTTAVDDFPWEWWLDDVNVEIDSELAYHLRAAFDYFSTGVRHG